MNKSCLSSSVFIVLASLLAFSPAMAAPSGAIFTTTANGSQVNANLYSSKCEVYLDGGPGVGAPAHAAGLADGDYYFQVTDASGKQLLSTDVVSNRRFQVTNGVITAYTGTGGPVHPIGYDRDHPELGAITIRVANAACPADFLDSRNGGGVYKVWVTPVNDFTGNPANVNSACGAGCFHGFLNSKSKTDNFKAEVGADTFCLTVWKRVVDLDQGTETPGAQWKISILDPLLVHNDYYTAADGFIQVCGLSTGAYTIEEEQRAGYSVVGLTVNGEPQSAEPVYSFFWSPGKPEPVIIFKNGISRRSDD